MASAATIAIPPDPILDGARGLFAAPGTQTVTQFLTDRGWDVQDMRAVQALYRPGSSCAVRYRVRALNRSGQGRSISVTAETRSKSRKPQAARDDFEERYGLSEPIERSGTYLVWAFPYDPALRGLEDAAWGPSVRAAMQTDSDRPRAITVEPLRYRPARRALFRYRKIYGGSDPTRTVYGKVLRTVRARTTLELAEKLTHPRGFLRRRGKTPPYLALPIDQIGDNVLLFDPMEGRALRDILLTEDSLPEPRRLVELMQSLQELAPQLHDVVSARHSHSPAETVDTSATLLTQLLPELRAEIEAVGAGIDAAAERSSVPRVVVHGDFYDAQVLVRDDFSLGVVDVDDLGLGDPALDAANFTTHLLALAVVRPASKSRLLAYRSLAREAFMAAFEIGPADLAWREALVMMQLAPGPFRVLEPNWPNRVTQHVRIARRLLDQDVV